jgi:hypothetical protein
MSGPKINGEWKTPASVYVKIGGVWKIAAQTYSKIDGVWKETTLSSPPAKPRLNYFSTGKFIILGYDSSLVYEASLVSGSGTATLDTSTGIYTLSGANSAFNVVARYAVGALPSDAAYMERKAITQTFVAQCNYITASCTEPDNYPAASTTTTETYTGDTSNCAPYTCPSGFQLSGPDGSNRCLCTNALNDQFVIGGGLCPGSPWYVCSGNKCCYNYTETVYSCPAGGTLQGTTCIRDRTYDCSYWESCFREDPVPSGYTKSGGEWWRVIN